MHSFNPQTKIESAKVNENFTDLSTGEADVDDNSLALTRSETLQDHAVSGLEWSIVSGLNGTMTTGVAYITDPTPLMVRISVPTISSRTFTASKDTYVDMSYDGTITYTEVTLTTAAPALAANNIRLAFVRTDGTDITIISQSGAYDNLENTIRPATPHTVLNVNNPYKFHVYRTANYTGTSSANMPLNGEVYDHMDMWDNTGYSMTPVVDGYYQLNFHVTSSVTVGTGYFGQIVVNGTERARTSGFISAYTNGGAWGGVTAAALLYLKTTDSITVKWVGTNNTIFGGSHYTYFSGFLVSEN